MRNLIKICIRVILFPIALIIYTLSPISFMLSIISMYIYSMVVAFKISNFPFSLKCYPRIKVVIRGGVINIGKNSVIDKSTTLYCVNRTEKKPCLRIGADANIGELNHITCVNSICIGNGFLSGKMVTITDNSHGGGTYEELDVAPYDRAIYSKNGVVIGNNVWLGDKVTVLPGVKIGDNVIVGANSVVSKDIPDGVIAAGVPAKVIKKIENE